MKTHKNASYAAQLGHHESKQAEKSAHRAKRFEARHPAAMGPTRASPPPSLATQIALGTLALCVLTSPWAEAAVAAPPRRLKSKLLAPPPGPAPTQALPRNSTCTAGVACQLSHAGGPVIENVNLTAVYWGDHPNKGKLDKFMSVLPQSPMMDMLAREYSVKSGDRQQFIGRGQYAKAVVLDAPSKASGGAAIDLTDDDIASKVRELVDQNVLPHNDGNQLTVLLTPPGVFVKLSQGLAYSCFDFGGYHNYTRASSGEMLPYVVIPFCQPDAVHIALADTVILSHEIAEAITDPLPPSGWVSGNQDEIADPCGLQAPSHIGPWETSQLWSNDANGCIGYGEEKNATAAVAGLDNVPTVHVAAQVTKPLSAAGPLSMSSGVDPKSSLSRVALGLAVGIGMGTLAI
jgi:hypothetical protein